MNDPTSDPAGFVELFVRHQREMLGYVLPIVGSLSDAQDVLQEGAMEIWRCWHHFDAARPFLPWAKGVLRNKALMFLRSRRRLVFLSEELAESLCVELDQRAAERERRVHALDHCLERLSPQDRQLLQHRYDDQGRSLQSLAEEQGRSANSLYKSLGRIRRQLLSCIEGRLATGESV